MKTITLLVIAIALLFAADQPKPASKVAEPSSALVLEIAKTHRDLLLVDAQINQLKDQYKTLSERGEELKQTLGAKVPEATKACGEKRTFDIGTLTCKDAPATEKK